MLVLRVRGEVPAEYSANAALNFEDKDGASTNRSASSCKRLTVIRIRCCCFSVLFLLQHFILFSTCTA